MGAYEQFSVSNKTLPNSLSNKAGEYQLSECER